MRNIHGKVEQEVTPLWDSLISQSERISFHMPGHRQGRSWPSHIKKQLAALDTTELAGTGDLDAFRQPMLMNALRPVSEPVRLGLSLRVRHRPS